MSFFTYRVSIQWPPEEASEPTFTMVTSAPSGEFVDLRYIKDPKTDAEKLFPFDWGIIGKSVPIGDDKLRFDHSIDSRPIMNEFLALKLGEKYEKVPGEPDVGKFSTMENGDRREDGEMINFDTGKIQPYVEIWRTLDGDLSKPGDLVRFSKDKDVNETKFKMFEIDSEEFQGRYIVIGKWGQGILNRKKIEDYQKIDSPISCIRTFEGKAVVEYGIDLDQFPVGGVETGDWKITESN